MNTHEALRLLGVSEDTLSGSQMNQLDDYGHLVVHDLLEEKQLKIFRSRLDELYEKERDDSGLELTQEVIFDICFTHPIVLAAVSHIFRSEFKTNSLNYKDALPHCGLQRLHPDYDHPVEPRDFFKCNALWLIDPHTGENGSTRLVPRSHLSG